MSTSRPFSGILSPVVTPFDSRLRPDAQRLIKHCRWLLDNDVGLAVFGTNSEANSLSVNEKIDLLENIIERKDGFEFIEHKTLAHIIGYLSENTIISTPRKETYRDG